MKSSFYGFLRSEKTEALVATFAIAIKKSEVATSIPRSPTVEDIGAVTAWIVIPK